MLTRRVTIGNDQIDIEQNLETGHAGTVWDGALVLVAYLNKHFSKWSTLIKDKVVLEVGAGTGIVGLACNLFHPKTLILTDFKENLELLKHNSQKNFPGDKHIHITDLHWGDEKSMFAISQQHKVDVIVGSELAYDEQNTKLLLKTIDYFRQQNPQLLVLIGYTRYPQPHKNLKTYLVGRQHQDISSGDMDDCYRDESIGIIVMRT